MRSSPGTPRNPMNALLKNDWTEAWADIGRTIDTPRAILCISAHWYPQITQTVLTFA